MEEHKMAPEVWLLLGGSREGARVWQFILSDAAQGMAGLEQCWIGW